MFIDGTDGLMYNGDCFEVLEDFADHSIDMVMVDLPYGTTSNAWDSVLPLDKLWAMYDRIVKPTGALVFTAAQPFDKVLGASNLADYRYEWIWHKNRATGHLNAKKMPMRAHENVLVFYKKQPTYHPQMTSGHAPVNVVNAKKLPKGSAKNYNHADQVANEAGKTTRYPRSVLNIRGLDGVSGKRIHPTQKPVDLMGYMISTYTNEGDVVLDNTMGSGTTCVAAKGLNRKYVGIETDETYFNAAVARVKETVTGELLGTSFVIADFQQTKQKN